MLKILVAEDEPPILRGICNKILKAYGDCEIVHRSVNGLDAAEYLRKNPVDIVFTDINMPQMSGIELLKFIQQNYPETYTVILSGYQEFQYARQAIQSNAYDYLLKPLETESVRTILETLARNIYKDKLRRAFRGEYTGVETADLPEGAFHFIALCAGAYPTKGEVPGTNCGKFWNQTDVNTLLADTGLLSLPYEIIENRCRVEKIIILEQVPEEKTALIAKRLELLLQKEEIPVTIFVSGQSDNIGHLYEQYTRLTIEYPQYIRYGQAGVVFLLKDTRAADRNMIHDQQKLRNCLLKGHVSMFRQELELLAASCEEVRITQSELDKLLSVLLNLCRNTEFIKPETASLDLAVYEAVLQNVNIRGLFSKITELLVEAHSEKETITSSDKAYLIEQIEKYITAHLTEPITNQLLSEHFGLGAGYISSLFKNYRGTSPSEYLLHARIEKAKELLTRNPELFAKDVAEIVGYSDPLYFSRVFKKVTGVYPSEYRKQ